MLLHAAPPEGIEVVVDWIKLPPELFRIRQLAKLGRPAVGLVLQIVTLDSGGRVGDDKNLRRAYSPNRSRCPGGNSSRCYSWRREYW